MNKEHIAVTIFLLAASLGLADIRIDGDGCSLQEVNSQVSLLDSKGVPLLHFNGLDIGWGGPKTQGGVAVRLNENALKATYHIVGNHADAVGISAIYRLDANRLTVEFLVAAPSTVNLGGAMISRRAAASTTVSTPLKIGLWQRAADTNGIPYDGIPYEVKDAVLRRFANENTALFETITGNPLWYDTSGQHVPLQPLGTNTCRTELTYILMPLGASAEKTAATLAGRPASIHIISTRDFNLFEKRDSPNFKVSVANTTAKQQSMVLKTSVRDYDGQMILDQQKRLSLTPGEELVIPYALTSKLERNMFFAETSIQVEGKELFARTMLAVMPPYNYKHKDKSIFGIAAAFQIPSKESVDGLLKRMGVRWHRSANSHDTLKGYNALANYEWLPSTPATWRDDPAKKRSELKGILEACDQRDNHYWETGNEWNMAKRMSGYLADVYVKEWLVPIAELRKSYPYKVKIMTMGLAGPDTAFLKGIHENGGWPLIDAVAFHPGRGNFTPDYADKRIYWSYLTAIMAVKKTVTELGEKPIWITEAYANTTPNGWWYDTYRTAAENVVLTFALALAEDIKGVMFYQLHDSVWHNKGGVNPDDNEYFYGLLDRKGAVKPSLLAYCAIAEALDGATFSKRVELGEHEKGLIFNRPDGQMAILWSRREGYVLSKKAYPFPSPEPWVKHWKESVTVSVPVKGKDTAVFDSLGRKTVVVARAGKVSLKLDGAPLIIMGTDYH